MIDKLSEVDKKSADMGLSSFHKFVGPIFERT